MIVPFHSFLYQRVEQSPRVVLLKIFFETSQNSQGNSCTGVSFLIKLQVSACEFCGISENAFSYRIASMAASERLIWFSDKGLRERERERERERGREGGRESQISWEIFSPNTIRFIKQIWITLKSKKYPPVIRWYQLMLHHLMLRRLREGCRQKQYNNILH